MDVVKSLKNGLNNIKNIHKRKKNPGVRRRPEGIECLFVEHTRPRPREYTLKM
jgi:hypothetical protein